MPNIVLLQKELHGLTIEEAKKLHSDISYRIVRNNGKPCVVTYDMRPTRCNVHVEGGKISFVSHFG